MTQKTEENQQNGTLDPVLAKVLEDATNAIVSGVASLGKMSNIPQQPLVIAAARAAGFTFGMVSAKEILSLGDTATQDDVRAAEGVALENLLKTTSLAFQQGLQAQRNYEPEEESRVVTREPQELILPPGMSKVN